MKEFRSRRLRVWENINRTMQEFKVLLLGYRSYTALLTQTGTNAPTAIVLENTIGDIVWTRVSDGDYYANLIGGFTINKTAGFLGSDLGSTAKSGGLINWNSYNNAVNVMTFDGNGSPIDDGLLNTFVEIRVYN